MSNFTFSNRSLRNLRGVHPDLIRLTAEALRRSKVDFVVTCGIRTPEEQERLVNMGKSWSLNSPHLTGYAVDVAALVDGKVSWRASHYAAIAMAFADAAAELGISIRWGGDWDRDGETADERNFDGPHFELDRPAYDWSDEIPPASPLSFPSEVLGLLKYGSDVSPVDTFADLRQRAGPVDEKYRNRKRLPGPRRPSRVSVTDCSF